MKRAGACSICGRRCRVAKWLCPLCRDAFASTIAALRELPVRSA